jgi:hypothetical protein
MESKGKGKTDLEDDMDEEPMDEPENENEEEAGDQGTMEEDKKLGNIITFMYIRYHYIISKILEDHRTECVNSENFKEAELTLKRIKELKSQQDALFIEKKKKEHSNIVYSI